MNIKAGLCWSQVVAYNQVIKDERSSLGVGLYSIVEAARLLKTPRRQALDSAVIIQAMIQLRKQMDAESEAKTKFGLSDEEVAFYDTLVLVRGDLYDQPFLAKLVRDIVPAIRENLKPDWTRSSREDIQAAIRSAVRRMLIKNNVKKDDFDLIIARIMEHAQAVYADWPQMPV